MSQDAPAEIVEAARAFLSRFAGVEVDPATVSYMEHGSQRVLEFSTPEGGNEVKNAERELKKSLGFFPDRFADSHGVQMAWDLVRDRKRVFIQSRYNDESLIGFCHWD